MMSAKTKRKLDCIGLELSLGEPQAPHLMSPDTSDNTIDISQQQHQHKHLHLHYDQDQDQDQDHHSHPHYHEHHHQHDHDHNHEHHHHHHHQQQQQQPPQTSSSSLTSTSTSSTSSTSTGFNCMNGRMNSDFERNKFIVTPDQPAITTDQQPEEVFEELDILGMGSGGHVLKMIHKPSGKICAVKQMRRTVNEEENKRIYMDLKVVLECECDNIVRCCGYFIKEAAVWICMELMTTCFDKLLKARKKPLPEKFLGALSAAALRALHYLKEEKGIIHRDVKPSNILINDQGQIKLCDFGISGRLIDSMAKTRTGCLPYMAPERIEQSTYGVSSDVWSLGITLFELAVGKSPYADCSTDFHILSRVVHEEAPTLPADMDFSPEFRDFISSCLIKNHKKRPKYRQLLEHKFIEKHKDTVVTLDELDLSNTISDCNILPSSDTTSDSLG